MKVGLIGAGRMATTIGRHLIGAGHEVVLSSSRGPERWRGSSPIWVRPQAQDPSRKLRNAMW